LIYGLANSQGRRHHGKWLCRGDAASAREDMDIMFGGMILVIGEYLLIFCRMRQGKYYPLNEKTKIIATEQIIIVAQSYRGREDHFWRISWIEFT
jgi:hypothetical protein